MMQRSVGLRANSRRSRGKIAFSGRGFAGTESERIRRSVELPSESLNLSLPAARSPFSSIPYAEVRVSSTT